MIFSRAAKLIAATAAVLATRTLASPEVPSTNGAQSVFRTPDGALEFAITIPDYNTEDVWFALAMAQGLSWAAVGLGSDRMAGALVLAIYPSADGRNVTLSPRLGTSHSEPAPFPGLRVEAVDGTGLANGTLLYRGRCANCRRWPGGGVLDLRSSAAPALFALGPPARAAAGGSDRPDAPLTYHRTYGSFALDLRAATGPSKAPVLDADTVVEGATLGFVRGGARDWFALVHAVFMVAAFVGLMPLGVLVLRVGNWVRWHAVNQGIALVLVIVGFGLGVKSSSYYQRSINFNSGHQVLGLTIFLFLFAQFTLGFLHHRKFKKTEKPTKLSPIHVWLGRLTILLGVVNAFIGFSFAQAPSYNYILGGLVSAVALGCLFVLTCKILVSRRRSKNASADAAPAGYDSEPWRHQQPGAGAGAGAGHGNNGWSGAPPYAGSTIGMSDMSSRRDLRGLGIGVEQTPREYI